MMEKNFIQYTVQISFKIYNLHPHNPEFNSVSTTNYYVYYVTQSYARTMNFIELWYTK